MKRKIAKRKGKGLRGNLEIKMRWQRLWRLDKRHHVVLLLLVLLLNGLLRVIERALHRLVQVLNARAQLAQIMSVAAYVADLLRPGSAESVHGKVDRRRCDLARQIREVRVRVDQGELAQVARQVLDALRQISVVCVAQARVLADKPVLDIISD